MQTTSFSETYRDMGTISIKSVDIPAMADASLPQNRQYLIVFGSTLSTVTRTGVPPL